MRQRSFLMLTIMLLVWSALWIVAWGTMRSNAEGLPAPHTLHNLVLSATAQRNSEEATAPITPATAANPHTRRLIVIGFVGGFVNRDEARHPEVQLAAALRRRYSSSIYVQVFGNHQREAAHRQVLHWLDTDADGALTADEKRRARIIIYGHSWGASEAVALARELSHRNIPVLLTIQVDSIGKPGHHDGSIPPNVANAVNFYQPDGFFHGCQEITAVDPERTKILGNFRMSYSNEPITSGGSSWFARLFMKSHIQIEDDPRIWQQVSDLIDEQFSASALTSEAQSPLKP